MLTNCYECVKSIEGHLKAKRPTRIPKFLSSHLLYIHCRYTMINYRPIPLLSIFSKILERLMYHRLLEFLNKHKLLNKFQFGFRNMHSTFMALITLLDNLRNALDSGNCAVGYFLTFKKHSTLLIIRLYWESSIVMEYVVLLLIGSLVI